jgi:hypothetical protein
MYTSETVGAFALYTVLIALFSNPVIDAIKNMVGSQKGKVVIICFSEALAGSYFMASISSSIFAI